MPTQINGRKTYLRKIDPEQEKHLDDLIEFLTSRNLMFYSLTERNEGSQKYIDVMISIKLS